jgi:hypothetical protein
MDTGTGKELMDGIRIGFGQPVGQHARSTQHCTGTALPDLTGHNDTHGCKRRRTRSNPTTFPPRPGRCCPSKDAIPALEVGLNPADPSEWNRPQLARNPCRPLQNRLAERLRGK